MLTDRTIRDAKPKANVYRLRDANVVCRGFGATIAPSGAKAFFLSYTSPEYGKRKQVAIGRFQYVSLKEARLRAGQLREMVNSGKDPAAEKQHDINNWIADRALGTFGAFIEIII